MDARQFQELTQVSRETLDGFEFWRAHLTEWNIHTNLVGRSTLDDFWTRHAFDSWQVYEAAPEARVWLDLGSGAGSPGLAIALAFKIEASRGGVFIWLNLSRKRLSF